MASGIRGWTEKQMIKKILLDTVPVILGVLIALLIGEWKSGYDDRRYFDRILVSMEDEARGSLDEINDILPRHVRLLDSIEYYLEEPDVNLLTLIERNGGLQVPTIQNRTWNAVITSRIDLVDYELISLFNQIDESKEILMVKVSDLTEYIFSQVHDSDRQSKELLKLHVLNVINSEEQLVDLHQRFLDSQNQ